VLPPGELNDIIPELRITLQGAATWRIQRHDPTTTWHIAGCCQLANSGCDTVSQFAQVRKKTAWKVWEAYDKFTDAFYEVAGMLTRPDITRPRPRPRPKLQGRGPVQRVRGRGRGEA